MVKVVCISDTHTYQELINLPPGDILVHAGDFTFKGREEEVRAFGKWFRAQPHKHKLVISGNHDLSFESDKHKQAVSWLYNDNIDDSFTYLQDTSAIVEVGDRKIKVYGSPWQPEFCSWAFNLPRGKALKDKWDLIPSDTDILITHSPPYGYGDLCDHGKRVGCEELVKALLRVKPKLHCIGHIHEAYGVYQLGSTVIANASVCNANYKPINKPLVFELNESGLITQI